MADIFISYSMPDRGKAVMLAAYLESEGWSVWWDNNLAAGDAFRDDIARELTAARAVIVIWTQASVKSDFVRAEAGRAKADGKLIPVKERDVAYGDIPLPFGEMHTEDIANRELLRAAIVTQMAKPAPQPKALHVLRYQMLTWMGIVGGTVTLFTNLSGILNLADWARWLVTHWHEWTSAFWQWCFSFIHIKVPQYWTGLLSFLFFGTVIAFSQRMIATKAHKRISNLLASGAPALPLLSIKTAIAVTVIVLMPVGMLLAIEPILAAVDRLDQILGLAGDDDLGEPRVLTILYVALLLVYIFSPLIMLVIASNHRLKVTGIVALVTLFFVITAVPATLGPDDGTPTFGLAFFTAASGITAVMLMLAPVNTLLKRLTFLAIGLILLVALNALSHYAPDIRDWLKPPVAS